MNCYEAIDVMGEAAEDRLDPALRSGFEEHLAECSSCGTYFEHIRYTRLALRHLPRAAKSPRRRDLMETYLREFESEGK